MVVNYITKDSIIIFAPHYNEVLDIKLLTNYNQIIFSNFELNDNLFDAYSNNEFINFKFANNKFNQSVNNLPPNITHLTFGPKFNQKCEYLLMSNI